MIEAIRSIEQISVGVAGGEGLRLRFFENKLSPYHDLIALSIERHEFDEALEIAERSKARVLTRLLGSTRDDHTSLLDEEEKREQTRLRDAVHAVNQQITREQESKAPDQARLTALESARRSAREAVAAFESVLVARLWTVDGDVACGLTEWTGRPVDPAGELVLRRSVEHSRRSWMEMTKADLTSATIDIVVAMDGPVDFERFVGAVASAAGIVEPHAPSRPRSWRRRATSR